MKLKKAYKVMQANCGIEVGDTVKVLRKAVYKEFGWGDTYGYFWIKEMDVMIGKTFVVVKMHGDGVVLEGVREGEAYNFPFFVLQKVEPEVIEEPLAVGQWFEKVGGVFGGEHFVLSKINGCEYALCSEFGTPWAAASKDMLDTFGTCGVQDFTRITTPFQVVPK